VYRFDGCSFIVCLVGIYAFQLRAVAWAVIRGLRWAARGVLRVAVVCCVGVDVAGSWPSKVELRVTAVFLRAGACCKPTYCVVVVE